MSTREQAPFMYPPEPLDVVYQVVCALAALATLHHPDDIGEPWDKGVSALAGLLARQLDAAYATLLSQSPPREASPTA